MGNAFSYDGIMLQNPHKGKYIKYVGGNGGGGGGVVAKGFTNYSKNIS